VQGAPEKTQASNIEQLSLASRHSVDVVIVHSFMLEMDGREVAVEIKRLKPQVTITMLSGAVDVPEAVLDWVDAFVAKDRVAGQLLPAMAQLQAASGF
jgi:CheY-like chemotaxis protein